MLGGLALSDAGQGGDHGSISQSVDTDGKAELPVPGVIARGCQCNGRGMPLPKGELLLGASVLCLQRSPFQFQPGRRWIGPFPCSRARCHGPTALAIVLELFDSALPVLTLPNQVDEGQVLVTQRTFSLLTMKSSLVEGPECSCCLVTRGFLQLPAYCPVQLLSRSWQPSYLVNRKSRCQRNSSFSFWSKTGQQSSRDR